ncbi:MAG: delta-60 repeat domain-containing protein, partial [Rubrobacteraceae bacterium]
MERKVMSRLMVMAVMVLAMMAAASPAWAAEGDPDTSFSGDGKTTTPVGVGGFEEGARDVALQPDGKMVAAGSAIGVGTGMDFALARYDADGELDPSFGTGGKVLTDMGSQGRDEEVRAVAVQTDGKIVVAGITGRFSVPPNATDIAVARYNPNGSLDTSFSGDGKFTLDFGGKEEFAGDLAVQSDGKIVVAGTVADVGGGGSRDFALIRLNPGGGLDTTFDTDGIVTTDIINSSDDARAVEVQANGKIVAGGSAGTNFALARYNANGSLDTSFDTDGKVFTNVVASGDEQILDLAFAADTQADKKIVVAGDMSNNFAVARYNANGSLDTTFDTDGVQTTDFGSIDEAFGLVVAGDNKVTVAGRTFAGNDSIDFALARYNASGALDSSFSNDGKRTTDFENTSDEAAGISLQADGKAVVAGESGGRFAL